MGKYEWISSSCRTLTSMVQRSESRTAEVECAGKEAKKREQLVFV